MSIVLVQSVTGAGPTIVLNGVAAGNALILQSCPFRNVATGVAEAIPTDSNGTFLRSRADAPSALSGEEVMASCFHQLNCAAGTHTVTPQANLVLHLTLTEWSGLSALDASVAAQNGSGTATSQTTGTTGATIQAEELSLVQFAMGAVSGGSANVGLSDPQTNYTTLRIGQNDASDLANQHAYQILSAVGTQALTFVWTFSAANQWWQASIVTFRGATSAGGIGLPTSFHPGLSPGLGGISSARFQTNWWPYPYIPPVAFDPAFMIAMEKHGNDPLVLPPQVVASGMTPPEEMPT